jgi:hypothetical protein
VVSSSINETEELSAALSRLNMSSNRFTGNYQNAHLTNVCIPNYGMDWYPINPVFPSMAGSYIDTNTLTDSFDDPATASAVGAVSMDSRSDINGVHGGRSGSTADLHNLCRLNGQVEDKLQMEIQ